MVEQLWSRRVWIGAAVGAALIAGLLALIGVWLVLRADRPVTIAARVCATCGGLRVRAEPSTSAAVVTTLDAGTPLTITARTADNAWVSVTLPDGEQGWVAASYLAYEADLSAVALFGANGEDAPDMQLLLETDLISGIGDRARAIFREGQRRGNLPQVFVRVGDSISADARFLTPIAQGRYDLGEHGSLADTIAYFSAPDGREQNPFGATSAAVRIGWTSGDVLDPAQADPRVCQAGESPLACEYRLARPAIALILFGTNDVAAGRTLDSYRDNLRQIVEFSLEQGVIPVLSTIPPLPARPDLAGRILAFNRAVIDLAREYDVPLWNYWRALQAVPDLGISADGVHPSAPPDGLSAHFDPDHLRYGYTVRNLTALQVLDRLRRDVLR
ncbi:MAG: SH3 domain-containing protein [Chloroflexi bacterium]|nr:SH3 domain-containing protein [Chloroflexota bacterium]